MERSIFDLQINTSQPIRGSCYNNAYFKLYHETIEVYRRRIVSVAKTNTAKRTGIIVKPLSNPFSDIFDFGNEMSAKTDIWNFSDDTSDSTILSNKNYLNGAALILCDEVMDKVVEHYKVNVLYILPSSIHEVIIIPDSDSVDVEYLKNMVYEINRSTVAPEERLSDHVYKYTYATKSFEML